MSRNAAATPSAPRRGPQWSRLRHHESSTSSPDRSPSVDSHTSLRSASTHSTVKDPQAHSRERYCTITVNDGYLKDEVLLNFDRLGTDVTLGSLMAITALKGDPARGSAGYGSLSKAPNDHSGSRKDSGPSPDQDYNSSRYVFVAKDMSKEMKSRLPDVDVSVSKHIADAFGMKKGSHVMLAPVSRALSCLILPFSPSTLLPDR